MPTHAMNICAIEMPTLSTEIVSDERRVNGWPKEEQMNGCMADLKTYCVSRRFFDGGEQKWLWLVMCCKDLVAVMLLEGK